MEATARPRSVGVVVDEGEMMEPRRELHPRTWELVVRSVEVLRCNSTAPRVVVTGVNILLGRVCRCSVDGGRR